jgi:biotin synthase
LTSATAYPIIVNTMNNSVHNWNLLLDEVEHSILAGENINFQSALKLTEIPEDSIDKLFQVANNVRQAFNQNKVDLCSIINARSGKCSEDCKFCTQSKHNNTDAPVYPMKEVTQIVDSAKISEENGAHRFCIVTSGLQLNDSEFQIALEAIEKIGVETDLKRCASMGKLTLERARQLKEAGLSRYHHNLETSKSFFSQVCTTHTYEQKIQTINYLKDAGIETCVGGILNLGETAKQRIEFAYELKAVEPDSVPINILNPRPQTPLENRPLISALQAAQYLAIFRLIMPKASIRLAGGRLETFKDDLKMPFLAGVNALLVGDLLTTKGADVTSDISQIKSLGFNVS